MLNWLLIALALFMAHVGRRPDVSMAAQHEGALAIQSAAVDATPASSLKVPYVCLCQGTPIAADVDAFEGDEVRPTPALPARSLHSQHALLRI
jgi:hypothetical protein